MTELHLLAGAGTTAATATADAVVVGVLPARSDEDTDHHRVHGGRRGGRAGTGQQVQLGHRAPDGRGGLRAGRPGSETASRC